MFNLLRVQGKTTEAQPSPKSDKSTKIDEARKNILARVEQLKKEGLDSTGAMNQAIAEENKKRITTSKIDQTGKLIILGKGFDNCQILKESKNQEQNHIYRHNDIVQIDFLMILFDYKSSAGQYGLATIPLK